MTREEAMHKWVLPAIERTWNDRKCKEIIKALEPKTGHWIHLRADMYECSECGCIHTSFEIGKCDADYCPKCGRKNVEVSE